MCILYACRCLSLCRWGIQRLRAKRNNFWVRLYAVSVSICVLLESRLARRCCASICVSAAEPQPIEEAAEHQLRQESRYEEGSEATRRDSIQVRVL